jgi:hypothetical protein
MLPDDNIECPDLVESSGDVKSIDNAVNVR